MSSLYGSLAGLQELGLLDTVTYLSGVSGSTGLPGTCSAGRGQSEGEPRRGRSVTGGLSLKGCWDPATKGVRRGRKALRFQASLSG